MTEARYDGVADSYGMGDEAHRTGKSSMPTTSRSESRQDGSPKR